MNLRERVEKLRDRAYCHYIDQMGKDECLGYQAKMEAGKFGKEELEAHNRAHEFLGAHRAYAAIIALLAEPSSLPEPPQGKLAETFQSLAVKADWDV